MQYPMVELITAGAFALSYILWPVQLGLDASGLYFGLWLGALVLLIAMAVYDAKWLILPDRFNWPLLLISLCAVAVTGWNDVDEVRNRLLGAAVAWSFFAALYYGSKGRWIGGGDVKFALSMGLWLGFPGVLVGLAFGFYGATLIILPLLLLKIVKRSQPIPFGPFLIAGTIAAHFFAQQIITWYKDLFFITA